MHKQTKNMKNLSRHCEEAFWPTKQSGFKSRLLRSLRSLAMTCTFKRIISAALVVCFTATSVQAAPPVVMAPARSAEFSSPSFIETFSIPESLGTISNRLEAVTVSVLPVEAPSIVIIQDAHAHYDAQQNTRRILQYLKKEYGLETLFVEGALERLNPKHLLFFPQPNLNEKAADLMAREGLIGGPELFLFDEQQKGRNPAAQGIEDGPLYRKNLRLYRHVLGNEKITRDFVSRLKAGVLTEGSKRFNPELQNFFREWVTFQEHDDQWQRHLDVLAAAAREHLGTDLTNPRRQAEWPQLLRIFKIRELENNLPEEKAAQELESLLAWADRSGLQSFRKGLAALPESARRRDGQSVREFLQQFYAAAKPKGFSFDQYPAWGRIAGRAVLENEIRAEELIAETEKITGMILDRLAQSPEEKKLIRLYQNAGLLGDLFSLELVPEKYLEVKKRINELKPSQLSPHPNPLPQAGEGDSSSGIKHFPLPLGEGRVRALDRLFIDAVNFYGVARRREKIMQAKIIEGLKRSGQSRGILIVGGFHTPGMTARLERAGFSYAVVSPQMASVSAEDYKNYRSLMTLGTDPATLRSSLRAFSRLESIGAVILPRLGAQEAAHAAMGINSIVSRILSENREADLAAVSLSSAFRSHRLSYQTGHSRRGETGILHIKGRPAEWQGQWVGSTPNGPRLLQPRSEIRAVQTLEIQIEPGQDPAKVLIEKLTPVYAEGNETKYEITVKGTTPIYQLGGDKDPAKVLQDMDFSVERKLSDFDSVKKDFWEFVSRRLSDPKANSYTVELIGDNQLKIHWGSPLEYRGVNIGTTLLLLLSPGRFSESFLSNFKPNPRRQLEGPGIPLAETATGTLLNYLKNGLALSPDFKLPVSLRIPFTAAIPDDIHRGKVIEWIEALSDGAMPAANAARLISTAEKNRLNAAEQLRQADELRRQQQAAQKPPAAIVPAATAPVVDLKTEVMTVIDDTFHHPVVQHILSDSEFSRELNNRFKIIGGGGKRAMLKKITVPKFNFAVEDDFADIRRIALEGFAGQDKTAALRALLIKIEDLGDKPRRRYVSFAGSVLRRLVAPPIVPVVREVSISSDAAENNSIIQSLVMDGHAGPKEVDAHFQASNSATFYHRTMMLLYNQILTIGFAMGYLTIEDLAEADALGVDIPGRFRRLAAPREPLKPILRYALQTLKQYIDQVPAYFSGTRVPADYVLLSQFLLVSLWARAKKIAALPAGHPLASMHLDLMHREYHNFMVSLEVDGAGSLLDVAQVNDALHTNGIIAGMLAGLGGIYASHGWMFSSYFMSGLTDRDPDRDLDRYIETQKWISDEAKAEIVTLLPELTAAITDPDKGMKYIVPRILEPILKTNVKAAEVMASDLQGIRSAAAAGSTSIIWELSDFLLTRPDGRPMAEALLNEFLWKRSEVRAIEPLELEVQFGQDAVKAVMAALEPAFSEEGTAHHTFRVSGKTPVFQLGTAKDPAKTLGEMGFEIDREIGNVAQAEAELWAEITFRIKNPKTYGYTVELIGTNKLKIHWDSPLELRGAVIGPSFTLVLKNGKFSESFMESFKPDPRQKFETVGVTLSGSAATALLNYMRNGLTPDPDFKLPVAMRIPFTAAIPDDEHRRRVLEWVEFWSEGKMPAAKGARLISDSQKSTLESEARQLQLAEKAQREREAELKAKEEKPRVYPAPDIREEVLTLINETSNHLLLGQLRQDSRFVKKINEMWRKINDAHVSAKRAAPLKRFNFGIEEDFAELQRLAAAGLTGSDVAGGLRNLLTQITELMEMPRMRYLDYVTAILRAYTTLRDVGTPGTYLWADKMVHHKLVHKEMSPSQSDLHHEASNSAIIYMRLLMKVYNNIFTLGYGLGYLNANDLAEAEKMGVDVPNRFRRNLPAPALPLNGVIRTAEQKLKMALRELPDFLSIAKAVPTYIQMVEYIITAIEVRLKKVTTLGAGHPLTALQLDMLAQEIAFLELTIKSDVFGSVDERSFEAALQKSGFWNILWTSLGALFAAHGWMTPYFYSSGLRHKDLDKQVELARVIIPEAREKITKILPEVIQLTQLMPAGSPEFMSQLARILGPILETNPAAVVELSDAILTGKIFEGRGDGIIWEISDLVFASAGGQPLAEKIIHSFLLRSARSEVRTAEDAVPLGEFSKWDELEQEVMRLFEQRMFAEIALGSAEDMAAGTWKERVDLTHEPVMQQRQPADYLRETLQIIRQQYLVSEMDVPGLKHAGWRFRLALEDAGYHFKLFTVKPPEEKNTILAIVYSKTEESARSEVRAEGAVKPSESLDEITAQLASFRQSRASYEQTISGNGSDTERTAARMNMSRIGKRIASLEAKLAELQKQRAGEINRYALLLALELGIEGLADPANLAARPAAAALETPRSAVLINYMNALEIRAENQQAVLERARRFADILVKSLVRSADEMSALLAFEDSGLVLNMEDHTYSVNEPLKAELEALRAKITRPAAPAVQIEVPKYPVTVNFRHDHTLSDSAESRIDDLVQAFYALFLFKKEILKAPQGLERPDLRELTAYLNFEKPEDNWTEASVNAILHDLSPLNPERINYVTNAASDIELRAGNGHQFAVQPDQFQQVRELRDERLELRIKWQSQVVRSQEPADGATFDQVLEFFENAKQQANDGWKFFYILLGNQTLLWTHLTNYLSGAEFDRNNPRHRNRLIQIYNRIKEREFAWRAYEKIYLGDSLPDDLIKQILEDENGYFIRFLYRLRDFYSEKDFFRNDFFKRSVARIIEPENGFMNGKAAPAESDWLDREQTRRRTSSETPLLNTPAELINALRRAEEGLQRNPKDRELAKSRALLAKQLRLVLLENAFALADFRGAARGDQTSVVNEAIVQATGATGVGTISYWRKGKQNGARKNGNGGQPAEETESRKKKKEGKEDPSIGWEYFSKLAAFALDGARGSDHPVRAVGRLLGDDTLTAKDVSLIFPSAAGNILKQEIAEEDLLPPAAQFFLNDLRRHSERGHTDEVAQRFFRALFNYTRAYEGRAGLDQTLVAFNKRSREILDERKKQLLEDKFANLPSEAFEASLNHRVIDYLERPLIQFMSEKSTFAAMPWDTEQEEVPADTLRKILTRLNAHLQVSEPAYHVLKELALRNQISPDQLTVLAFVAAHPEMTAKPDPDLSRLKDALATRNLLGRGREKVFPVLQSFHFRDSQKRELINRLVAYLRSLDWNRSFYETVLEKYGSGKTAQRQAREDVDAVLALAKEVAGTPAPEDGELIAPEDFLYLRQLLHNPKSFSREILRNSDQPEAIIRRLLRFARRLENVFDKQNTNVRRDEVVPLHPTPALINLAKWMNDGLTAMDLQAFLYQRGYRLENGMVERVVSRERLMRMTAAAAAPPAAVDATRRTEYERGIQALVHFFFGNKTDEYENWESFRAGLLNYVRTQHRPQQLEEIASVFGETIDTYLTKNLESNSIDPVGFYLKKTYDKLENSASPINRVTLFQALAPVLEAQGGGLEISATQIGQRLAKYVGLGLAMRERQGLKPAVRDRTLALLDPDSQASALAALYFDLLDEGRGLPPYEFRMHMRAKKIWQGKDYNAVLDEINTELRAAGYAPLLIVRRRIKNLPTDIFYAWKNGIIKAGEANLRGLIDFLTTRRRERLQRQNDREGRLSAKKGGGASAAAKREPEKEKTPEEVYQLLMNPHQGLLSGEYEEDFRLLELADPAFAEGLETLMEAAEVQSRVVQEKMSQARIQRAARDQAEQREYDDAEIDLVESDILLPFITDATWALDDSSLNPEKFVRNLIESLGIGEKFVGSEKLLNLILKKSKLLKNDVMIAWAYWRKDSLMIKPKIKEIQKLLAEHGVDVELNEILAALERLNDYSYSRLGLILFVSDKTLYLSDTARDGEDQKLAAVYRIKIGHAADDYADFMDKFRRERKKNAPDVDQAANDPDFVREVNDRLKWKLDLTPTTFNALQAYRLMGGFAHRDVAAELLVERIRQKEDSEGRPGFDESALKEIAANVKEVLGLELKVKQPRNAPPSHDARKLIAVVNPHDYYHDLGFTDDELDEGLPSQRKVKDKMHKALEGGSHKYGDGQAAYNAWMILSRANLELVLIYRNADGTTEQVVETHVGKARYDQVYEQFRDSFKANRRSEVRGRSEKNNFDNWKDLVDEVLLRFQERSFARITLIGSMDLKEVGRAPIVDLSTEPAAQRRQPEDYLKESLGILFEERIRPLLAEPGRKTRRKKPVPPAKTDLHGIHLTLFNLDPPKELKSKLGDKPILLIIAEKPEGMKAARSEIRAGLAEAVEIAETVPLLIEESRFDLALEKLQEASGILQGLEQSVNGDTSAEAVVLRKAALWNLGLLRKWEAGLRENKEAEDRRRRVQKERKILHLALLIIEAEREAVNLKKPADLIAAAGISEDSNLMWEEAAAIADTLQGRNLIMMPELLAQLDRMAQFGLSLDESSRSYRLSGEIESLLESKPKPPAPKPPRRPSDLKPESEPVLTPAAGKSSPPKIPIRPAASAPAKPVISTPAAGAVKPAPPAAPQAPVVAAAVFTAAKMSAARQRLLETLKDKDQAVTFSLIEYLEFLKMIFFDNFPAIAKEAGQYEHIFTAVLSDWDLNERDLKLVWLYWTNAAGLQAGEVLTAMQLRIELAKTVGPAQAPTEAQITDTLNRLNVLFESPLLIVDRNQPAPPKNPAEEIVSIQPDLYALMGYKEKDIKRMSPDDMPKRKDISQYRNTKISYEAQKEGDTAYHLLIGDMSAGSGVQVTVTYGNKRTETIEVKQLGHYNKLYARWLPNRKSEVRTATEAGSLFVQARRFAAEAYQAETDGDLDRAVESINEAHGLMSGLAQESESEDTDLARRAAVWSRGALAQHLKHLEDQRKAVEENSLLVALAMFRQIKSPSQPWPQASNFIARGLKHLKVNESLHAQAETLIEKIFGILIDLKADEDSPDAEFREWTPETLKILERLAQFGVVLNEEEGQLDIDEALTQRADVLAAAIREQTPAEETKPQPTAPPQRPAAKTAVTPAPFPPQVKVIETAPVRKAPAPEPPAAALEIEMPSVSLKDLPPLPPVLENFAQQMAAEHTPGWTADKYRKSFQALRYFYQHSLPINEALFAHLLQLNAEEEGRALRELRAILGARGYGVVEIVKDVLAEWLYGVQMSDPNFRKGARVPETSASFLRRIEAFRRIVRKVGSVSARDFAAELSIDNKDLGYFEEVIRQAQLKEYDLIWDLRDIPAQMTPKTLSYGIAPAAPAEEVKTDPKPDEKQPPAKPAPKEFAPDPELDALIRAYRSVWYRDGGATGMTRLDFAREYDGSVNGSALIRKLEKKLAARGQSLTSIIEGMKPLADVLARWNSDKSDAEINLTPADFQKMIDAYRKIREKHSAATFPNQLWADEAEIPSRSEIDTRWKIFSAGLTALGHSPADLEKGIVPADIAKIFAKAAGAPPSDSLRDPDVRRIIEEEHGFSPESATSFITAYRIFVRHSEPVSPFRKIYRWIDPIRQGMALRSGEVGPLQAAEHKLQDEGLLERIWFAHKHDDEMIADVLLALSFILRIKEKDASDKRRLDGISILMLMRLRQLILTKIRVPQGVDRGKASVEALDKVMQLIQELPLYREEQNVPGIRDPYRMRFARVEGWLATTARFELDSDIEALRSMLLTTPRRNIRDDRGRGRPHRSEVRIASDRPGLILRQWAKRQYGLSDEPVTAVARNSRWIYPDPLAKKLHGMIGILLPRAYAAASDNHVGADTRGALQFIERVRTSRDILAPFVHVRDTADAVKIRRLFETADLLAQGNRSYIVLAADNENAAAQLSGAWDEYLAGRYAQHPEIRKVLYSRVAVMAGGIIPRRIPRAAKTVWVDWLDSTAENFIVPERARATQVRANVVAEGALLEEDENSYAAALLQAVKLLLEGPEASGLVRSQKGPYVQRDRSVLAGFTSMLNALREISASA